MEKRPVYNPTRIQLDDAYRSLPKWGQVEIVVDRIVLTKTLATMEKIGYVAIVIIPIIPENNRDRIIAFKGKHGPCFDTGRKATYTGVAMAALDDDNHLLIAGKNKPICEKTAKLYQLPPFKHLITVYERKSHPEDKAFEKPVSFQDNSFEEDQETIYRLVAQRPKKEVRSLLFYPGPFKMLILSDGTIICRGENNNVPLDFSKKLIQLDRLEKAISDTQVEPIFFQDVYVNEGSKWLISDFVPTFIHNLETERTDFSSLRKITPTLKKRLAGIIEKEKKYFILTGSDPANTFGCCPSEDVGAANRLVQAGILSSCGQQIGTQDCPVTIYAFNNEINSLANELSFQINEDFRGSIYKFLIQSTGHWVKPIIRWILLSFVAVSLIFAYLKFTLQPNTQKLETIFSQIVPNQEVQISILLFHYQKRCLQCTRMELFTKAVLEDKYQNEITQGTIQFTLVNMDQIDYRDLIKESGLFSATMFLLKFNNRILEEKKILTDAWRLYSDEEAFKAMLIEEIDDILSR
jgi:hypothetical protein